MYARTDSDPMSPRTKFDATDDVEHFDYGKHLRSQKSYYAHREERKRQQNAHPPPSGSGFVTVLTVGLSSLAVFSMIIYSTVRKR